MRNWKHHRGDGHASSIDPAFVEALAGKSDRKFSRKSNYKALQLCRQVQRVLTLALLGETGDEVLREVYVAEVTPAAGGSQLLVHVSVPAQVSVVEVLERLQRATPRLRAAVAAAITRKRAPELMFIPAGPEGVMP